MEDAMRQKHRALVASIRARRGSLSFSRKKGLRISAEPDGGLTPAESEAVRELASELRLGHIAPGEIGLWEPLYSAALNANDRNRAVREVCAEAAVHGVKLSRESLKAAVRLHVWLARRWPRWMPGWIPEEEARRRLIRILRGQPAHIDALTNEVVLDTPRRGPTETREKAPEGDKA